MGELSITVSALERRRSVTLDEQLAPCMEQPVPSVRDCVCEWVNETSVVKHFKWLMGQKNTNMHMQ